MEWKLPERLKPKQYLIATHAGNNVRMECSLRYLAGGTVASANHLNQTLNQTHHCHGDFDGIDSLLHRLTLRCIVIDLGNACSSSHLQPLNKAILE
jgi:hypothetical protein